MKHRLLLAPCALLLLGLALWPAGAGAAPRAHADRPAEQIAGDSLIVRVYYDSIEDLRQLSHYDLLEVNKGEEKYVLAIVPRAHLLRLAALGFRVAVDADRTASLTAPRTIDPGQAAGIPGFSCYRTVEETYAAAAALAAARPDLAAWIDVGDSWEKRAGRSDGYDLMVLRLTNSAITGDKPKLFVTASLHAREYAPAELATRFAEHLVSGYGIDADATWILDHHEVHLVLQANPDGRKEAETGAWWRKNTNENYCGTTSIHRGADLNRNFAFYWNYCPGCSSGFPCDATYRGPSAGSEPETQAIQDYLRAIFPDQRGDALTSPAPPEATGIYIDLHSYGRLVMWPWGFQGAAAPNGSALQTLGRKFARFNGYAPQQAYELYPTDGSAADDAYGQLGVAAYVFELGTAFFQDCSTFESTIYPANLDALLYAAKIARTPYRTPAGPDALDLVVTPGSAASGVLATLTATIDDTRYGGGTSEPAQNVVAVEYYIDTPPWIAGATPRAMAAGDGSFDSPIEGAVAAVNAEGLAAGNHLLLVRGRDAAGNWGAFSAAYLAGPLAVGLTSFAAEATADGVTLSWETVFDVSNAGFNLYRAVPAGGRAGGPAGGPAMGPWTRVNAALIPAQTPGAATGGSYALTDAGAPQGVTLWYMVENVSLSGATTRHAPLQVAANVPNAVSIRGFGAASTAWRRVASHKNLTLGLSLPHKEILLSRRGNVSVC